MGYVKGGSQKSLAAGGISALLLYFVYTQLPVRPAFASSLGLGMPTISVDIPPHVSTRLILSFLCRRLLYI